MNNSKTEKLEEVLENECPSFRIYNLRNLDRRLMNEQGNEFTFCLHFILLYLHFHFLFKYEFHFGKVFPYSTFEGRFILTAFDSQQVLIINFMYCASRGKIIFGDPSQRFCLWLFSCSKTTKTHQPRFERCNLWEILRVLFDWGKKENHISENCSFHRDWLTLTMMRKISD